MARVERSRIALEMTGLKHENNTPLIPSLADALDLFERVQNTSPVALSHCSEMIMLPLRLHLFNACTVINNTGAVENSPELEECYKLMQKVLPKLQRFKKTTTFYEILTSLAQLIAATSSGEDSLHARVASVKSVILACPEPASLLTVANQLRIGYLMKSLIQAVKEPPEKRQRSACMDVCDILAFIVEPVHAGADLLTIERRQVARLFLPGLTVAFSEMVFSKQIAHANRNETTDIDNDSLSKALLFWVPLLQLAFSENLATPDEIFSSNSTSVASESWNKNQAVTIVSKIIRRLHTNVARCYRRTKNAEWLFVLLPLNVMIIDPNNLVLSLYVPNEAVICDYVVQALELFSNQSAKQGAGSLLNARRGLISACSSEICVYSNAVDCLRERVFSSLKSLTHPEEMLDADIAAAIRSVSVCVDILKLSGRFSSLFGNQSSITPLNLDVAFNAFFALLSLDCSKLNFIHSDNMPTIVNNADDSNDQKNSFKLLSIISYVKRIQIFEPAQELFQQVFYAFLLDERPGLQNQAVLCCLSRLLDHFSAENVKQQQLVGILHIIRSLLQVIAQEQVSSAELVELIEFFTGSLLPALYSSTWWNVSTSLHSYNISRVASHAAADGVVGKYQISGGLAAPQNVDDSTPTNLRQFRECVMMQLLTLDISALIFSITGAIQTSKLDNSEQKNENVVDTLVPACLPHVIEKLHDDELLIISSHARQTLVNISSSCKSASLDAFLCRFMPVLVNIYALRMRHLELYPKSASALKSIVSISGRHVFFELGENGGTSYVWPLVDYCLDTFDRHYEHASSLAAIPLIDVLVAVLRRVEDIFSACDNKDDSHASSKPELPFYITVVERIARRFAFLLPTTQQSNNKKNLLQSQMLLYANLAVGLTSAFHILSAAKLNGAGINSKIDDILLPLIYQTWLPLANGLRRSSLSNNIHAFRKSFHLLVATTCAARDFVSARLMRQCFPGLIRFLEEQSSALRSAIFNNNFAYYSNSVYHMFECEMLADLPQLLEYAACNLQACQQLQNICELYKQACRGVSSPSINALLNSVEILHGFSERKAIEWKQTDELMSVPANLRAEKDDI